ncbi:MULTISPECIES: lipopolysaccharide biosynthesis protein [Bacteroidales]|jgi:teichuronic acid exporter|uniref:lipopolysaccharide biosynthesis protein n=1 Tax=Bacteroidales TaxID=171549 RepID=UPI0023F2736B|nr:MULTISPECIES: lipopolysaccharide biosynthesis protein [Bacteroidales]MDD2607332.1 lipopolysaccharide biosynthesis protein [Lascolabacillus sp.]MDD3561601.1 lipopolysaccharide biosynthesis protein [Petrimonas mucosa]
MEIRKTLFSGVLYTGISKYIGVLISLLIVAILSRLLSPDDFGIVAVATVLLTFFGLITDLGIAPAVIQNRELTKQDYDNLFSFTFWIALIVAFLFFILAGSIAAYYNARQLVIICRILTLSIFFNTINIVPNALLYKEKEFKFIAKRMILVQIITGGLAVAAALGGGGIFALLINPVLSAILMFIITIRRFPLQVKLTTGVQSLKGIFSYSIYQFLFNVINYFSRNLDKLLIGRFMGMGQLGYYEKSYRLMMLPLQNITHVITPVLHPVLADFQNDMNYLDRSYRKIVRLMAFIALPLSLFLFFSAKELILIVFGNQWEPSVPVFRILSLSVGIQIILSTSGSIFQAAGDTRSLFICGLFSAVTTVSGILAGIFLFRSLEAVAWCIVVTFTINFFQAYLQMYRKTFRLPIGPFFGVLLSPLLLSALIFALFSLKERLLQIDHLLLSLAVNLLLLLFSSAAYLQLCGEYNLLNGVKQLLQRR